MVRPSLLVALCGLLSGYAVADAPLANAVVIVIRHAEKPLEGDFLTPAGVARANAYPKFFKTLKIDGKPFHVDHIFASTDSKKSHRPRLTIEPTAKALNLDVDVRYPNKEYDALVKDLETHPYGKGIIISWHHGNIPKLLVSLGAPDTLIPDGKWPDQTFDWAVALKFDAAGKVIPKASKIIHEHLMPGDSK